MANICRKLGVNIYTLMKKANISPESFAGHCGYTLKDTWNIIEGKIMLPPSELEKISNFLDTTRDYLLNQETDVLVPELQYMKEFSNPDNLDHILDLMDEYVELRESVSC